MAKTTIAFPRLLKAMTNTCTYPFSTCDTTKMLGTTAYLYAQHNTTKTTPADKTNTPLCPYFLQKYTSYYNEQQRIQDLLQRTRRYRIRALVYYSHIPQSKIRVAQLCQISTNGTNKQQTSIQSALEDNTHYKQRNQSRDLARDTVLGDAPNSAF